MITVCVHRWTHKWFNRCMPILFYDDVGEGCVSVAKRYHLVTSVQQNGNISETLMYTLHQKFVHKKQKALFAQIWAYVRRNVVLEARIVAANVLWQTIFGCLLQYVFKYQDDDGCTTLMHTNSHFVQYTFVGATQEVGMFCVRRTCGTNRAMQR